MANTVNIKFALIAYIVVVLMIFKKYAYIPLVWLLLWPFLPGLIWLLDMTMFANVTYGGGIPHHAVVMKDVNGTHIINCGSDPYFMRGYRPLTFYIQRFGLEPPALVRNVDHCYPFTQCFPLFFDDDQLQDNLFHACASRRVFPLTLTLVMLHMGLAIMIIDIGLWCMKKCREIIFGPEAQKPRQLSR